MADAATLFPTSSGKVAFPEPGGSGLEWAAEADMAMLQDDPNFLEWLNGWLGGKADEDSVMENAFSTLNEFGAQIDFQQSLNQQQQQEEQQHLEADPHQPGPAPSSAPDTASVPSAAASVKRESHARNESCGSLSPRAHSSHPASDASGSLLAAASPCGDSDNSSGAASALRAWATADPLAQAQSLPPPHTTMPFLGGLINGTGAAQAPFGGYSVSFTGPIGAQQQQSKTQAPARLQAPLGFLDTSLLPHSITAPAALAAAAAPGIGTAADLNGVLRVPSHGTVSSFVGGPTCASATATTTTTASPLAPGLPTGGSAGHLGASLGTAGLGLGLGVAPSAGSVGNLLSGFNTTTALQQQQQQQQGAGAAKAAAGEQPGGPDASLVNVPSLERLLEMALYGTKGAAATVTAAAAAAAAAAGSSGHLGSCTAAERSGAQTFARDSAEFGSSGGEEPMAGVECGGWVPYGTAAGSNGGALPGATPSTSGSAHLRRRSSSHLALGSSGSGHHHHHAHNHHPHGVHVSHVTGHGHVAKASGGTGGRGTGVNAAGKLTRNARSKAVFAGLEAEVAGKLQQLEALQREHQTLTQKVEILQVAVDRQNVVLSLMHRTGAGAGAGGAPGAWSGKGSGSGSGSGAVGGSAAAAAAAAAVAAATAARAASGGLAEGSAGRQGDSGSVGSGAVRGVLSSCGSGGLGEEADPFLAGGSGLAALGLGGMGAGGLGLGGAGLMTAFAYVPRGPEGRELLEWARGCSVEGYIVWYKEYVKELSLALLELDSSGSSPATLDRLTQLVAGAGLRNSLVCVFQPTVHLRLKGLNLETGAYAEPADEHWINVIRFMTISAQEVAEMESLWESYNLLHRSFTAELQDTQRDLQELIGKAAGQGPAGARGGGGGGGRAQDVIAGLSLRTCSEEVLVTAMKQTALMKRVRSILQKTHLLYSCTIWVAVMRIMKPKEFARCVVHSYPYHPCGPSLMRACRTARELRLIWGINDPMCGGGGCGGQAATVPAAAAAAAAGPGAGLLSR